MSPTNALDIVEAAYQSNSCDEQWLSAVIDLSKTALDRGYGLVGHLYNYSCSDARQTTAPPTIATKLTRNRLARNES